MNEPQQPWQETGPYNAYGAPAYLPTPPKKRSALPTIIGVVVLVALVAGGAIVFVTGQKKDGGVVASVVDTTSTPTTTQPSGDRDGDGLSDEDEARYKTNSSKPDTDGDGFTDGVEVSKGYNPNGAGKLTTGAVAPTTPTTPTEPPTLAQSGVALSTAYGGGSYTCQVTGGVTKPNTVTVKIKDGKVRQETPLEGSTVIFIVDGTKFFMNGFKEGKWLELEYDAANGVASGPGANVKGGIFSSEALVLAAKPTAVSCEEANWSDAEFQVPAEALLTQEQ